LFPKQNDAVLETVRSLDPVPETLPIAWRTKKAAMNDSGAAATVRLIIRLYPCRFQSLLRLPTFVVGFLNQVSVSPKKIG
jgi:hypothetical protein